MAATVKAKKDFFSRLWSNIKDLRKMASFYVVLAASWAADYWLSLSLQQQAELIATYPFLVKWAPSISAACWVYARIHPQKSIGSRKTD